MIAADRDAFATAGGDHLGGFVDGLTAAFGGGLAADTASGAVDGGSGFAKGAGDAASGTARGASDKGDAALQRCHDGICYCRGADSFKGTEASYECRRE